MGKFVRALAIIALFIPFNVMLVLKQYYTWNNPSSPQVATGEIVPVQVNYGRTVYVTTTEANWLHVVYTLTAIGVTFFSCYVIVRVVKGKRGSANL